MLLLAFSFLQFHETICNHFQTDAVLTGTIGTLRSCFPILDHVGMFRFSFSKSEKRCSTDSVGHKRPVAHKKVLPETGCLQSWRQIPQHCCSTSTKQRGYSMNTSRQL